MPSNLITLQDGSKRLEVWIGPGGLNTRDPSFAIEDHESPDCKNVLFQDKKVGRRFGYSKLQSTDQPLNAANPAYVWNVPHAVAGVTWYVAACSTDLFKGSADDAWADTGNITGIPDITNGFGCRVGGYFILNGGGNDVPYKWNLAAAVTALDLDAQFTGAVDFIPFENFLLAIGTNTTGTVDNYGRRIWYSDVNQIEVWGTGLSNYADIDHTPGALVRGLVDGRTLYGMKTDSVVTATVTGDSARVFDWRVLSDIRGCPTRGGCAITPKGVFFISGDGFYNVQGRAPVEVADKIWASMRAGLPNFKLVGVEYCGEDREVWVGQMETATPTFYVYNTTTGAWSKQVLASTMKSIAGSATYEQSMNADTVNEFLVFGGNVGNIWKYDKATADDDGTAIDSYHTTKDFPMTSVTFKDRISRVRFLAKASIASQHLHLGYRTTPSGNYTDLTTGNPVSITANWAMYEMDVDIRKAETFGLKFYDTSLEYNVSYFSVDYDIGPDR